MKTLKERLLDRTELDAETGCWVFQGAVNSKGYTCISKDGKNYLAHRISYELHREPIPADMTIDHLCRNKRCVNPEHLEVVTRGENIRRSPASGIHKTHCMHGHEFTEKNTLIKRNGSRNCRECLNAPHRKNSGRTSSAYWAARRAGASA